jgi:hypothetical protein
MSMTFPPLLPTANEAAWSSRGCRGTRLSSPGARDDVSEQDEAAHAYQRRDPVVSVCECLLWARLQAQLIPQ